MTTAQDVTLKAAAHNTLRRSATAILLAPSALVAALAKCCGVAAMTTLILALCALSVTLPLAWALRLAANALRASAADEADEQASGARRVTPLECRG